MCAKIKNLKCVNLSIRWKFTVYIDFAPPPVYAHVYTYTITIYIMSSDVAVGRQFSEDPLVNYGVWGFIAGIMNYFVK